MNRLRDIGPGVDLVVEIITITRLGHYPRRVGSAGTNVVAFVVAETVVVLVQIVELAVRGVEFVGFPIAVVVYPIT